MEELTINQVLEIAAEFHRKNHLEKAEEIYKKVLEKNPKNPDALHLLGLISFQKGKNTEAIELIKLAISQKQEAVYYGNLGMVYNEINDEENSKETFEKALEINPNYPKAYLAHYNLGVLANGKEDFQKALEHYDKAIELADFPDAHWNKSLILLLFGNLAEGFKEYKYRFKKISPTDSRDFGKPKLKNSEVEDKKILAVSEQGFGDTINFIRYLKLLKEKNPKKIILECRKEIFDLMDSLDFVDEVIVKKQNKVPDADFDFYVHLMDLPEIFGTTLENIPFPERYIKANPELVEKFKSLFKTGKSNIGICWAGNPKQDNDKNRSANFEIFKILKDIPNVKFFSLQKGEAEKQLNDNEIINLSDRINNFSDTAAMIESLDLIISVDTSVSHLSAAMGKPTFVLLTKLPDWRYQLQGEDSPWYKNMRLFRQKEKGDWVSLMKTVKKELEKYLKIKASDNLNSYKLIF